jgi:hypothetical protein
MTKLHLSHVEDRRSFVSEAFHSFHQPLTALHCGLELSLLKERDEADYRQRLQDALTSAGAILELNKAMRELVEATDPGENFGRVELKPLLAKLAEDLSYSAEPGLVALRMACPEQVFVAADADKFARNLGNLGMVLLRSADLGAALHLKAHCDETTVLLKLSMEGARRESADRNLQYRLDQMRVDAACSYAWTIGGEFKKTKKGFAIGLSPLH